MTRGSPDLALDDGIDFKAVAQRFRRLNTARLARARNGIGERQRVVLDLLPLLFHVNHPMLPGYAGGETPVGVAGYEPDEAALEAARRIARSLDLRRPRSHHEPILSLFLMGSAGTVAQSESSDFDIWLCHDPELEERPLQRLEEKARGISAWAEELGLEVHFFLMNPERFRRGEVQGLSEESSGSAQFTLLLEEFYRSAILIAGQPPLWWMVPPEREAEYDLYVAELHRRRFIHARDHIDLGGLGGVPAEEFFGAALWQLYKGIQSPYKAALKLLLIESYAGEYPEVELLGMQFKRAVYAGEADTDRLDPYLMMLEKVEQYLAGREDARRLELARRCLYIKVNIPLSRPAGSEQPWQRDRMSELVAGWGWRRGDLVLMDGRKAWKVHRVAEERRLLFEALAASYRFLSDFARRFAGSLITRSDLTTLGRKLYAAFERKAGKVELLVQGVDADLHESHLTLREAPDEGGRSLWELYRGSLSRDELRGIRPLKRCRSVVELAAWCHFNRIADRRTLPVVHPGPSRFDGYAFSALMARFQALFPSGCLDDGGLEAYAGPARVQQAGLFVNVALDMFAERNPIATARPDPLTYGATSENLVQELELVLLTSWGEVLIYRYAGAAGLMEALCEYLKWAPPGRGETPPRLQVQGGTQPKGNLAAQRLGELIHDVTAAFYGEGSVTPRYVVALGRGFGSLRMEGESPRYRLFENGGALMRYLSRPQPAYNPVMLDRYALTDTPLPAILAANRPGWVQFFYWPRESNAEIYVLDERGSLFSQTTPFFDASSLVGQFSRFFEAVLNRMNLLMQDGQSLGVAEGVEFYRVRRDENGTFQLGRQRPEFRRTGQQYFSLQVIVEASEEGGTELTIYCDGREFSTLEHGSKLFDAVVRHVLELRRSGQAYPVYITDIGLSRAVIGEEALGRVQTIHFLNYKRSIEEQFNRAMPT